MTAMSASASALFTGHHAGPIDCAVTSTIHRCSCGIGIRGGGGCGVVRFGPRAGSSLEQRTHPYRIDKVAGAHVAKVRRTNRAKGTTPS